MRVERERTDQRILAFFESLSEADLSGTIRYTSIANKTENAFRLDQILMHLFLHQTHHRGQVTTLIGQLGMISVTLIFPVLDGLRKQYGSETRRING